MGITRKRVSVPNGHPLESLSNAYPFRTLALIVHEQHVSVEDGHRITKPWQPFKVKMDERFDCKLLIRLLMSAIKIVIIQVIVRYLHRSRPMLTFQQAK